MKHFFDWLRRFKDHGAEYAVRRYYSKYIGTVENTADPQGQGRVRVSCRVATGRTNQMANWAYPSSPYAGADKGMFWPPDAGDLVWVWFDHGDTEIPRYSGSWWRNSGDDKAPNTSEVPAEFRPGAEAPTKRGMKTKAGHGLLFDDTEDEHKVELWTGEQTEAGAAAERRHEVKLDSTKGAEKIVVASFGGHRTSWIDVTGEEAIESKSAKGYEVTISDADDKITIKVGGYEIIIDQKGKKITATTAVGQKIEMLDTPPTINVQDSTGNKVTLSPVGIDVVSTAIVNITAQAAVNITAQAAASITAQGALSLTGIGGVAVASTGPSSMSSIGASTNSYLGIKNDTFLGGLVQSVLGLWSMSAVAVLISGLLPNSVWLGSANGVKFRLVDERLLVWLASHTHPTAAIGPPSVPAQPILAEILATNYTRAD